MCRKFLVTLDSNRINTQFRTPLPEKYRSELPSTECQPGTPIVALTHTAKGFLWYQFTWGLIPHWSVKNQSITQPYNARIEGITTKKMFCEPIQTRRCLIPATCFFEFQKQGGSFIPHQFHRPHHDLFAFAGIWDLWVNPETQSLVHSAAIITMPALPQFKAIHHRLPVIIAPTYYDTWLQLDHVEQALSLCDLINKDNQELWDQMTAISSEN